MKTEISGETQWEGLGGLRVVSFESRRATEMAELIRRHGGEPISAPSMREVPLSENRQALDYVARLAAGEVDIVILMTGVGLRTLARAVAVEWPPERLAAALRRATLVARGPKPVAALRELGLEPDVTVPEPNTWREILATLDAQLAVAGKRVAVQEYGVTNTEFIDGLAARGAAGAARADLQLGAARGSRAAPRCHRVLSATAPSTSHCSPVRRRSTICSKSPVMPPTGYEPASAACSSRRSDPSVPRHSASMGSCPTWNRRTRRWVSWSARWHGGDVNCCA